MQQPQVGFLLRTIFKRSCACKGQECANRAHAATPVTRLHRVMCMMLMEVPFLQTRCIERW
jgi:hypothetical protein